MTPYCKLLQSITENINMSIPAQIAVKSITFKAYLKNTLSSNAVKSTLWKLFSIAFCHISEFYAGKPSNKAFYTYRSIAFIWFDIHYIFIDGSTSVRSFTEPYHDKQ